MDERITNYPSRASAPLTLGLTAALALGLLGCGDATAGSVTVLVEAEDTILHGIPAGGDGESIQDGWEVIFDAYVVTMGAVELGKSSGDETVTDESPGRVYDLTAVDPAMTHVVYEGVAAGRWDLFSFTTAVAGADSECAAGVAEADCERVRAEGLTYLIRGRLEKAGGESCPPTEEVCHPVESVEFELAVVAPTRYSRCEDNGVGGVAVPEGGDVAATVTLHGDHLFFNTFPAAAEDIVRRAQWLANADLDQSGGVDMVELAQIPSADFPALFTNGSALTFETAFSFTGAPIPVVDAARYLEAQLSTQGHLNGEGECGFEPL